MKQSILKIALLFIMGFLIGDVSGMDGATSGGVAVAGSAMFKKEAGTAYAGYDISEVTSQLGNYWRKYEKSIWRMITTDIQLETYTRKVPGITDEYVTTKSEHSELLQPFQKAYTPKGDVAFVPRINKVRQLKIDYTIDCMDDLYKSYLHEMANESEVSREKWPLVKYIIQMHIIPGIREELETMSGSGDYAAPIPGTPGAMIDGADGFLTIIADEILATNLVPIATGAITQANAVDRIEFFNDSIPSKYDKMPGIIFCSPTVAKFYKRDYRNEFGSTNDQAAKDNLTIDGSKRILVPVDAFAGSSRLLYTPSGPTGNMITMYDKIYALNNFSIQLDKREVIIVGDFKRGWGFGTLDNVFVNDQT